MWGIVNLINPSRDMKENTKAKKKAAEKVQEDRLIAAANFLVPPAEEVGRFRIDDFFRKEIDSLNREIKELKKENNRIVLEMSMLDHKVKLLIESLEKGIKDE